jgi:hypothetical protein
MTLLAVDRVELTPAIGIPSGDDLRQCRTARHHRREIRFERADLRER